MEYGTIGSQTNNQKKAIGMCLELKYGVDGLNLLKWINNISLVEKLEAITDAVKISKSKEEIEKLQ